MKKSKKLLSVFLAVLMLISTFATIISNAETAITYGGMELEVVNDFTEFELKYGYVPNESSHKFETKANRATHYGQVLQVNGGSTIKYSVAAGAPMSEFYLVQYKDSETLNSSSKIKHSGWHKGNVTLDANTKYIFINIKTTTTSLTEEQIEAIISSFVLYDETTKAEKEAKLAEYREKHSAVLNWEFAEDANLPELFTAALEDYAALGSYERSLLSDEEKANLEKIPHYYNAEDYRTEHQTVLELDLSGEVEEYIDAMIAAINGYDALADLTKSFLTEAEINQIEKMRNDVALPYFVNKFNANHADALALTVETATADDEEKVNAAIAEYTASYPIVKAALAEQISLLSTLQHHIAVEIKLGGWDGTDDFSDTEKSSLLWTDGLTNYIKDGKFYIPKKINWGPADYALVDGIIAENDKPVAVNFDINLLNTDYGPRFNLFTGKTKGPIVDFQCAGGKFIFDVDANGWSKKSSTGGTSIFTGVQNVNIDYNWENWAVANEVTVTVTLSQNGATKTLTGVFLFTESETNIKPTVFNLGFAGTNNGKAVYIDNFELKTLEDIKQPNVMDGSLFTDGEEILLSLDFDFLNPAKYIEYEEYSIVKYGIVAAAGKPANIKADAELLLDGDTSNDPAKYTVLETKMVEGDFIPDNYFVTVTNSSKDEGDTGPENIGKRVSAIAYVVYEKDGVETIAYSRESFYASPIGLLKKEFIDKILPANTEGGVIVTDSALDTALNNYNTANSSDATLDTILEAVNTTEETTAEQKDLLIDLYLSIGE